MTRGFVSLVGAGPGDPGLLTVAGRERLAEADVVIYDRLVNPVLLSHCRDDAETLYAGKSPGGHTLSQAEINALLIDKASSGNRVVRLKGGDPFVFGRGGEEALALAAAGLPFEVIPGVTAAIAAPAYAGVPVTHRGLASSFAVITGHEEDGKDDAAVEWARLATAVDTLVILMGAAALDAIAAKLVAGGRSEDTPAVSIEWGTTSEQRSVAAPLAAIGAAVREAGLMAPLLTVVGEVASLRDHIGWFETRPLFGRRILVTRTRQQASSLSDLLRREGAVPIELPTLELQPAASDQQIADALQRIEGGGYEWVVFTSANAVSVIGDALARVARDARIFARCRVAAIGEPTAASLLRLGLRADLIAQRSTSEGLLTEMKSDVAGSRVLVPRAADGLDLLPKGLQAAGATVDELILYAAAPVTETPPEALSLIRAGRIAATTFASSSAVRNLALLLGEDFGRLKDCVVACIGPVTAATAREYGLTVTVEPQKQTIESLVAALRDHFSSDGR